MEVHMPASVSRLRRETVPLAALLDSWILALEGENKSKYTIRSYGDSVRALIRHAGPAATTSIATADLRAFMASELERIAPASAAVHYRNLRVFFGWVTTEEPSLMPASPMAGVGKPAVPRTRKPPLSEAEQRKLLATASGDDFESRRDSAILRVLIDTGMRVSGLAGLRWLPGEPERNDVLLAQRLLLITLKGGDRIGVPVGRKSVAAIDRYLRARSRHARAEAQWLWLGNSGPGRGGGQLTHWGVRMMLARRGGQAGVTDVHPHRFRRTFAHGWLESGGTEFDLMKITGWKSRDMIGVYADELGGERARTAHARLSPGDRL
jgi:integrase/recombinase XerD